MKNFSTIPAAEGVVQIPRGSFWAGGSEKELACDAGRPGVSRGDQIRAGQQVGGKGGFDVHASDGFLANKVVRDLA